MAVTEVLKGLGSWEITLDSNTPKKVMDAIQYFGHVVVHTGRLSTLDDSLLGSSRYTGVLLERDLDADNRKLSGQGMTFWLGDGDGKGDVAETAIVIPLLTSFENAIRAVLPASGSIVEGTLFSLPSTYSGTFKYKNPNQMLSYITDTMGAEFVVRGDGTLDAGLESDLYITADASIRCAVLRNSAGVDMRMRALRGAMSTADDVRDFTTRVVLLAEGEEDAIVTADADINPLLNPYKDIHGNAVKLTRIISESSTDATNANARAQLQLNRFTKPRAAMTLSTSEYDIKGILRVGDYAWIEDEDLGLVDHTKEVIFRGLRLNPVKLRITEASWPVVEGMSVAYRDNFGVWTDLSKYVVWESGDTSLVVGGYNRSLTNTGTEPVGSRPVPNTSVPDAPDWVTPFIFGVYQATDGNTKAQVQLRWLRPNNTDSTPIVDGSHYDIRYRTSSTPIFPSTHAQLHAKTHAQLSAGTHAQPLTYVPGAWQYATAPWDELEFMLQDLPTNAPYEVEIRAVDSASPPNVGAWSTTEVFQTSGDTLPPATPAAPTVAAGILTVQIVHYLGQAAGGTFNLDADLHHFEVHGSETAGFTPGPMTLMGKVPANNGMIIGKIPAVGSVPIDNLVAVYFRVIAVDNDGNASEPSIDVPSTAELIDDSHITNLTASKITAGTITSAILMAGSISTAPSGQRVTINAAGVEQYNASNELTSYIHGDEALFTGQVQSGTTGQRIIMNQKAGGVFVPEIRFFPTAGSSYSYINAPNSGTPTLGMNSGTTVGGTRQTTLWLFDNTALLGYTEVGTGDFKGGKFTATANLCNAERLDTNGDRNGGFTWNRDTDWWAGISLPSGSDAFLRVSTDTSIDFKGYFSYSTLSGASALLVARLQLTAAASVVFSYGATMQSKMNTMCTWVDYTGYIINGAMIRNEAFTGCTLDIGTNRTGHFSFLALRII